MKRKAAFFWILAAVVVTGPAYGQSNGDAEVAKTIWDGIYTSAQAERGQRAVEQNCNTCHLPTEWSDSRFIASWTGRSIGDLRELIQTTMPMDSPGRLSSAQYADIVAYILKLNEIPAGDRELPIENEELASIAVTAKAEDR